HVLCGFEPEKDFEMRADNGQKCFELWQEEAQRLYTKNGAEWMEKYQPSMFLLIKMLENTSVNSSALSDKLYVAGGWVWPCDNNRISVPFGKRVNPITNEVEDCNHINIVGEKGEPVYAACSGEVVKAEYSSKYGNYIEIKHTDEITSQYWHLSETNVTVGAQVLAGDTIGKIGATGMATGPNLGFVVMNNGEYVNPLDFYVAYDGVIVQ
ncbi:MAG: M23 family metallopeptidase, partial [Bacteroidales bacterium]|nr:M23 family metallopeptidase [Bacteroidales bacterium]